MKFETITTDNPNYGAFAEVIATQPAPRFEFDYNALAKAINAAPVGSILKFPLPAKKVKSVVDQMSRRGLGRGTDYTITVANAAEEGQPALEVALLQRVSDAQAEILEVRRGRPPVSA